MLMNVRTAVVQPGKLAQAMTWADDLCETIARLGGHLKLGTQVGGSVTTIVWIAEYKDFADYEARTSKLFANAEYNEIAQQAATVLVSGEIRDQLFRFTRE